MKKLDRERARYKHQITTISAAESFSFFEFSTWPNTWNCPNLHSWFRHVRQFTHLSPQSSPLTLVLCQHGEMNRLWHYRLIPLFKLNNEMCCWTTFYCHGNKERLYYHNTVVEKTNRCNLSAFNECKRGNRNQLQLIRRGELVWQHGSNNNRNSQVTYWNCKMWCSSRHCPRT